MPENSIEDGLDLLTDVRVVQLSRGEQCGTDVCVKSAELSNGGPLVVEMWNAVNQPALLARLGNLWVTVGSNGGVELGNGGTCGRWNQRRSALLPSRCESAGRHPD